MAELTVSGVSVHFGGVQALRDVDLTVTAGTVHGLIGPNGAGKTTLFNVITGLQSPDRGTVRLDGHDITGVAPHRRARMGIARTFQRLELFGTLTARENVRMAAETQRRKLPPGTTPVTLADALLERVGLRHVADEPTDMLPTGLARLVELARALAGAPSVLLLDEPSAGLNHQETDDLGRVLLQLAGHGMATLLVEHDMSLVMGICQQITVLDFGAVVARGDPATVRGDAAVQAAYLGDVQHGDAAERSLTASPVNPDARAPAIAVVPDTAQNGVGVLGAMPPNGVTTNGATTNGATTNGAQGAAMLELDDVRAAYGRIEVLHGVSLRVAQGSVVALLGPNGAGKSTLLKVASGRLAATAGTVRYQGQSIHGTLPERLAHRGLCSIPEGRSVFPNLTVAENLLMWTYPGESLQKVESRTFERFPVLGKRRSQVAGTLSGGEQQMLALARVLVSEPRLLLLDEISMGLAPLVVAELYEVVRGLAREGVTVVLAEQFVHAALSVATTAAIVIQGRIERIGDPEEIGSAALDSYLAAAPSTAR